MLSWCSHLWIRSFASLLIDFIAFRNQWVSGTKNLTLKLYIVCIKMMSKDVKYTWFVVMELKTNNANKVLKQIPALTALPRVFSEYVRSWTCGCLKMRTGEHGPKVSWTGTLRCCVWASSHCSVYWRATSQTSTQPCLQSWPSPSTTASWRTWGVPTSQSSLRVSEPMT